MQNKEIFFDEIAERYLLSLNNRDYRHKKIIISFSAIPGSGKTYIAKKIEQKYHALRINTDDIRKIIIDFGIEDEEMKQAILEDFVYNLFEKKLNKADNGLVILDLSIDRKYREIQDYANNHGRQLFVIRLETKKNLILSRLQQREDKNLQKFLDDMERYEHDFQNYIENHKPNIIVQDSNEDEISKVFDVIENTCNL
ncbi:MAG: AAA family ATPase [bacterium]|nr:AAA family ATPase [bacterium]